MDGHQTDAQARTTPMTRAATNDKPSTGLGDATTQMVVVGGLAATAATFALYGSSDVLARHLKRMGVQHTSVGGTARLESYDKPVPVASILNTALAAFETQIEPEQAVAAAAEEEEEKTKTEKNKKKAKQQEKKKHKQQKKKKQQAAVVAAAADASSSTAENGEEEQEEEVGSDTEGDDTGDPEDDDANPEEEEEENDDVPDDSEGEGAWGYTPFVPPGGAMPGRGPVPKFPEECVSCDIHQAKQARRDKEASRAIKQAKKKRSPAPATAPAKRGKKGHAARHPRPMASPTSASDACTPAHVAVVGDEPAGASAEEYTFDGNAPDVSYHALPPPSDSI
jgi:chemotaxis protein histidine kinase CheA